ncbi:MAG: penicillin-binding protein 2, partial [Chitinivibrionales bacterium]|nr:penicillin-binding protein 2 [Chitinivibrionales bacterium]
MAKSFQHQDELSDRTTKSYWLIGCFSLLFSVMLLRLFFLQVIQADTHIRISKENQMRLKTIKAPRGYIYDRNGVILARNRPSYSISILPYKVNKKIDLVEKLMQIHDCNDQPIFDSTELTKRIAMAKFRRFDNTILKEDVSVDIVSVIEEHALELPGILVQTESRREYPLGPSSFHVLGYMNEIPENMFDSLKTKGYQYGDKIGNAGIEKQYESQLRGKDGMEYIEVNAYGRSLGPIENTPRTEPIPGNDLYLSIDSRIQNLIKEAFPDTTKGAVVVLDPRNGELLAMYSSPSLDPNIFSLSTSMRSKSWAEAASDPSLPLNNRATAGTYPPGSTFKLVSALAAMESGRVSPTEHMPRPCTGAYRFGNRIAHCWKETGHGYLFLKDAVKVSCNVYFYQVGLRVGNKIINSYANMLGLGQYTGIDLPNERCGWLSGEEEYNIRFANRNWKWTQGMDMDLAIGQLQILTPLQLALMVGGLGNTKAVYKPTLLKEIRSGDGVVTYQTKAEVLHELNFSPTTMQVLHVAMDEVVNSPG